MHPIGCTPARRGRQGPFTFPARYFGNRWDFKTGKSHPPTCYVSVSQFSSVRRWLQYPASLGITKNRSEGVPESLSSLILCSNRFYYIILYILLVRMHLFFTLNSRRLKKGASLREPLRVKFLRFLSFGILGSLGDILDLGRFDLMVLDCF